MIDRRLEKEMALEFDDESEFVDASHDNLWVFGGRIAECSTSRPTLFLDTPDDMLAKRGCSLSVVLYSGFGTAQHKVVFKSPHPTRSIRNEVTADVDLPDGLSSFRELMVTVPGLVESFQDVATAPLGITSAVTQKRAKRTILVDGIELFLSFDEVTYLDPWGAPITTRRVFEVESDAVSEAYVAPDEDLLNVLGYFIDSYGAQPAVVSKADFGRSLFSRGGLCREPAWTGTRNFLVGLRRRSKEFSSVVHTRPQGSGRTAVSSNTLLAQARRQHALLLDSEIPNDTARRLQFRGLDPALRNVNKALTEPDRAKRQGAYEAHFSSLRDFAPRARTMLSMGLHEPPVVPLRRSFASAQDSTSALDVTFLVFEEVKPVFQQIHRRRAEMARLEDYRAFDVQVDLTNTERRVSLTEAKEIVTRSACQLYGQNTLPLQFMASDSIDAEARQGKDSRPVTIYGDAADHPRVSMIFVDDMTSVLALSHEVGHALHFLASTTFAETDSLLRETIARVHELACLGVLEAEHIASSHLRLETWRNQFIRPVYQTQFEVDLRSSFIDGHVAPSVEGMNRMYNEVLSGLWGSALQRDELGMYEWVKARHLFSPFSLVEYAVSFALGCLIVDEALSDGDKWVHTVSVSTTAGELASHFGKNLGDPSAASKLVRAYEAAGAVAETRNDS